MSSIPLPIFEHLKGRKKLVTNPDAYYYLYPTLGML